jgi:hypothetical protein
MSKKNVGKDCKLGLSNCSYQIEAYSEKSGKQYLVRANGYYEGSTAYGWVNAEDVKIKS